ncbi:MAG: YraN family protein [Thermodesulfobacteriota bacterium]
MTITRLLLGQKGEDIAVGFLERAGYKVLDRNFRCRNGEIDIIALDGKSIVFVEVKTRNKENFGPPKLAVNWRKQKQLIKVALTDLKQKKLMDRPARFDVVGIIIRGGKEEIELVKDAFGMGDERESIGIR